MWAISAFSLSYTLNGGAISTPSVSRSAAITMATDTSVTVGVLAIQGAFKEHIDALNRQPGVNAIEVRNAEELAQADALILPGGESTAQGHGLVDAQLLEPVKEFVRNEKPVWGVCAGMILLADNLDGNAAQPLIGGLNVQVKRNAFGRQIYSRVLKLDLQNSAVDLGDTVHFIRAPEFTSVEDGVEVLAKTLDGRIAAVQQDNVLATCFHPEVSGDDSWLQHFLGTVFDAAGVPRPTEPAEPVPDQLSVAPWNYMPEVGPGTNYPDGALSLSVKRAFAVFQKGGVIMDVVDGEQARIAEAAGAVAVMALERIPADIKADGGVARSSDPAMIKDVMASCSIPVMAKARIGHFAEAQVLEALEVDCIDESEVLTAADEANHIYKRPFQIPFVCGAQDLGEALRRIAEGACMIRRKGNAGTGNVVQATRHARSVFAEIRQLQSLREDEIFKFAKDLQVPVELVEQVRLAGRLPVVTFAAGGLATPADVSMLMQLGCDGVFVGSGIFKGEHPAQRARAMVAACTHYRDPAIVARVSEGLGKAMVGLLEHEDPVAVASLREAKARAGEGKTLILNGGIDPAVKA